MACPACAQFCHQQSDICGVVHIQANTQAVDDGDGYARFAAPIAVQGATAWSKGKLRPAALVKGQYIAALGLQVTAYNQAPGFSLGPQNGIDICRRQQGNITVQNNKGLVFTPEQSVAGLFDYRV